MKATIKFRTDRAKDWYVTKEFADEKHLDNYIGYICRTKQGYLCDEVFYDEVKDEACDYANKEELSENGLTAEEIKEYYLNTGNPDYEEEPYKSYTDTDWIECANLNDLER